jgi:hypothetical protein
MGVAVAGLNKDLFERFMAWRQKPHSYSIEWLGKTFEHSSKGVSGEAIQRNLDDVRAALNYAVGKQLPWAPKVPAVALELRSPPRDVTLTIDQLGAIVAYAAYDIEALRWVLGMIGTAARPDAVLKWNVAKQWKGEPNFDTHPFGEPKTKKRNAVVPLIPEFRPWLEAWSASPHKDRSEPQDVVADDARGPGAAGEHRAQDDPPHDRHAAPQPWRSDGRDFRAAGAHWRASHHGGLCQV